MNAYFWPGQNEILTFKGVAFNDGWEFDAPVIVYNPVQRYDCTGGVSLYAIEAVVEDICIDLCVFPHIKERFSESTLEEFDWRRWSVKGFPRRKKALHGEVKVRFEWDEDNQKSFAFLSSKIIKP